MPNGIGCVPLSYNPDDSRSSCISNTRRRFASTSRTVGRGAGLGLRRGQVFSRLLVCVACHRFKFSSFRRPCLKRWVESSERNHVHYRQHRRFVESLNRCRVATPYATPVDQYRAICGSFMETSLATGLGGTPLSSGQCGVDARKRLVAPEQFQRFEDAGRDRRAADRNANRLKNLVWLDFQPLDDIAQRGLDCLSRERLHAGKRLPRVFQPQAALTVEELFARLRIVARTVEEESGQRPEIRESLDLLAAELRRRLRGRCGR